MATRTLRSKANVDPIVSLQLSRSPFRKLRKPPKMILPKLIAAEYNRKLQAIVKEQQEVVQRTIIDHLPLLVQEAGYVLPAIHGDMRSDGWSENAERMLDAMRLGLQGTIEDFEFTASDIGQRTNSWHDTQWRKVMRGTVGVELFGDERWLDDSLKAFTSENVALIKELTDQTEKDIHRIVMTGVRRGQRADTIKKAILEGTALQRGRFRKTKTRAQLIAVDQVLTFHSQLNELRQRSVGVNRYRWRNSQDERVRGNPIGKFPNAQYDHWTREGKEYTWDNPPPDGHPGYAIRCRCYAEPVFDDLLLEEAA